MGIPWLLICVLTIAMGWGCGWAFWPGSVEPGGSGNERPGSLGLANSVRPPTNVQARQLSAANKPAGLNSDDLASALADPKGAGVRLKGSDQIDAIRGLCRQLALAPPPILTDFLTAVADTDSLRTVLLEEATRWACSREPEAGLRFLASLAERPDIAALTKNALHFFPPKDLPVVKAWYDKLPMGSFKVALLKELMPVLQRADRREAIRLASAFPLELQQDGISRQTLLGQVLFRAGMDTLSITDQQAMLQEFKPEDREFIQNEMIKKKFDDLRDSNKAAALKMLPEMLEAEKQFTKFYPIDPFAGQASKAAELFIRWAETDPLRASQGLSQLPEEAASPDLYRNFAAKWTEGNVGQASQWVSQLPEGPWKQAAITGLAGKLIKDYPADAITWAGSLTNPVAKMKTLISIISDARAASNSSDGLREAVDTLNLTEEERAELSLSTTP